MQGCDTLGLVDHIDRLPPRHRLPARPSREVHPGRTLTLLSVAHAFNHAQSALLPFVFLVLIDQFAVSVADIAFLTAISTIVAGSAQLAYGWLTRRVSRGAILGWGNVAFGVFTAVAGLASTFLAFGVSIVVSKLGGSPQHPVGNSLLAEQYPPARRGFAISAHIAGGNVGTVAVPVIGASLIALVGWGPTLVLFGVPAAVAGLAILWLVGESGSGRAAALAEGSARRAYGRVLRDRDQMLVLASSVVAGGARGLGVLNLFVPLYLALVLDLDTATIALMTTVLLIGSVPGPIVAGWLSDRLGRKPVIVGVYLLGAAAFLAFLAAGSDTTLVWGAIVLMSCFSFVESPQLQSLLADITVPGLRDAAFALYFTIVFVAGALWVAAYGVITDLLGDATGLSVVFLTMVAAYLLASLIVLPIRVEQRSREARAAEQDPMLVMAEPDAGGPY